MPRDCNHMPGAARDVKCGLCRDLAAGKPLTKASSLTLNNQEKKPTLRKCPSCAGMVAQLVSTNGHHVCEQCAILEDEDV